MIESISGRELKHLVIVTNKLSKIKSQFDSQDHPIIKIILNFKEFITKAYWKIFNQDSFNKDNNYIEAKDILIDDIKRFVVLIFFTTIKFYNLDIKDTDSNTDILTEIITDKVVKGDTSTVLYFVNPNWYSSLHKIWIIDKKYSENLSYVVMPNIKNYDGVILNSIHDKFII